MTDSHLVTTTAPAIERAATMHPLVSAAMANGHLDPGALDKLLDVQGKWELAEGRKAFTRDNLALKAELPAVLARDKTVSFTGVHYTHTSLAAAMDTVMGPLTRHGFVVSWRPSSSGNNVSVTCVLRHVLGHSEECTLTAPADNSGKKSPAQAIASTITLLERYTLLALLGIATADMVEPESRPQVTGSTAPAAVDPERNMAASRKIRKLELSFDDAAAMCGGRHAREWTLADLDVLRPWIEAAGRAQPPTREPGSEG